MTLQLVQDPQRAAADPAVSAFVTANAGSGKTKTLIDRVARLLLAGASPEAILCVTYTKAAAAEMQRRLFLRLGGWSVMGDAELADELSLLEGRHRDVYDTGRLSTARALFARALETPGGLKIQTIHAFCEKLLRRFPLEAGVSPGFRVMDDAAAAAVAAAARRQVAHLALKGEGALAEAYGRLSVALDYAAFQQMFLTFEAQRGALQAFFAREDGLGGARAWAWRVCGFSEWTEPEAVEAGAMAALDRDLWRAAAQVLAQGSATDQGRAATMAAVVTEPDGAFARTLTIFFKDSGEGEAQLWIGKAAVLKAHEGLRQKLFAEQERLDRAREALRAAKIAWDSACALTLAHAYLTAYAIEKSSAGALDFADLIEKTKALLASRPAAAWVLYKLDGGVDHVLVDEAQDTAPDQWEIVRALTGEFFAGESRPRGRAAERSLFVVGDDKQSIYSFQGADPARLLAETERYLAEIEAAGRKGVLAPLTASWRSTAEVLAFVDAVFAAGVAPALKPLKHEPKRPEQGCVDLWPLERETKGETREAWDVPLDVESEGSAARRLAENIACEIEDLVARGDSVGGRPARYGDVLILVRKRGALFEEILRALKHARIPVAGADRLALSEHIVFDDLMALARFVLFPDDDLTLAALLRSPFCDVDDESLYRLARGREGTLWRTLCARAEEAAEWRQACAFLSLACEAARERRPFEVFSRLLGAADGERRSMRRRLLRRLGAEAEDALDEFLAQVLAAEQRGVHDLERLCAEFAGLSITVKRELEAGRDEVRVMTAHGAKGLEAPIVFLPDAANDTTGRGSPLLEVPAQANEGAGFLWCGSQKADGEASRLARELRLRKEAEESLRLLYVALTRARERLVICGRISATRKEEGLKGWWAAIRAGFEHEGIKPHLREVACGRVMATRYGPDPARLAAEAAAEAVPCPPPAWADHAPRAEAFARYASPSDLGENLKAPAPSPLAETGGLGRFRRGDLIHRLLQLLPDLPAAERAGAAASLLARERDLTEAQRAEMTGAALAVLQDARFAEVFGEGSRAEVAIAGSAAALPAGLKISGRIDRLVVLADRVLVADFKTNRPAPARIEDADPAYLRQMAIYAAVLADIFPGRRIEAALIWTDGPRLMPVPEKLIAQSLAELGRSS
jgi:ATP-dependent helicase/nuclease subunit A